MTWLGQMVHVARKDARFARWILAGYIAIVVAGTAMMLRAEPSEAGRQLALLGVLLLGVLLLATVVQADSPADADAFWVSRPLEPSAVLGAKILFALVIVTLPLAGQAAGLSGLGVPPERYPRLLGESALTFGSWLLMAGALAALTASLRTFAAAFIGLAIFDVVLAGVIPFLVLGAPELARTSWLPTGMVAAGWLLVLVHQYLTRRTRRGVALAAVVFVAALFLPLLGGRAAPAVASADVPDSLRPMLRIISTTPTTRSVDVDIRISRVDGAHRYILSHPVLRILPSRGPALGSEAKHGTFPITTARLATAIPLPDDWHWLGASPPAPESLMVGVRFQTTADQGRLVREPGTRLLIEGEMRVLEPRVSRLLPLRAGATAMEAGQRLNVVDVQSTENGPTVRLDAALVRTSPSWPEDFGGEGALGFAVANPGRREAIRLSQTNSHGTGLALLLPGPHAYSTNMELRPSEMRRGPGAPPLVGPDWANGAELLLIDWVPVGSYPVTIEGAAPIVE